MSEGLINSMVLIIQNKDFLEFIRLVELTPEPWSSSCKYFRASDTNITLLVKLTVEGYAMGIQSFLNRCWQRISKEDAREALFWCVTHGTSSLCIRVLLEAAIERKPAYISRRAAFYFANFIGLYDISERVVRIPTFKPEKTLRLYYQNDRVPVWALPLHDAVAHHQVAIAELLIVERGAAVNVQSNGQIVPLAIACQLIYSCLVVLLLRHGANPNVPSMFTTKSQRRLRKLTKEHAERRGEVANLPMDQGRERTVVFH